MSAAGVLRRMTVRSDWAAAVARAEGARLLMPLMSAKSDQTRWHAQAALWWGVPQPPPPQASEKNVNCTQSPSPPPLSFLCCRALN